MFGLGPAVDWTVAIGVIVLLEILLFWVASALVNAPEISFGKTILIALVATAAWGLLAFGIGYYSGVSSTSLSPEQRPFTMILAGIGLAVSWLVPTILYVPALSISIPKSMLLSMFQMLLRAFLYVLIIAVLMVTLAGFQIYTGTDVRSELRTIPEPVQLFVR